MEQRPRPHLVVQLEKEGVLRPLDKETAAVGRVHHQSGKFDHQDNPEQTEQHHQYLCGIQSVHAHDCTQNNHNNFKP